MQQWSWCSDKMPHGGGFPRHIAFEQRKSDSALVIAGRALIARIRLASHLTSLYGRLDCR